ncbi:MAG: MarR family transcriptional regulator [Pseudomonadota bacterium]
MSFSLEAFLPYRLTRLAEAVSLHVRPVYKEAFGLNRPEWRVLAALADLGEATATEIGRHSTQHKTKVSRAIHALEQRRWLVRRTDPSDRRHEILRLTEPGKRGFAALIAPMRVRETAIFEKLSLEERRALDVALSGLERAMDMDGAREDF